MESPDESVRLDLKTDGRKVMAQAKWAGIKTGMRVADLGCGSGKTSFYLNKLVKPSGTVVGLDFCEERIQFANHHYSSDGIEFKCMDIRSNLEALGLFDCIWIRFVLEYYQKNSFDIVKNITKILKPGGIICMIDLDYNCLSHFGLPRRLEKVMHDLMEALEKKANFDPYAGRKLYSFLFDLGFLDIDIKIGAHHRIFGKLNEIDDFNWTKKVEVAGKKINYHFREYKGGFESFFKEFRSAFAHPRRFTYTPIILCKGKKPR
jgi:ubiquinone/menaquinone biosynthesis C-methylase UbiE